MSVINKMLRDLDHRQGTNTSGSIDGTTAPGATALRQGTTSVGMDILADIGAPKDRLHLWLGLGCMAVLAAAIGGWLWWSSNTRGAPATVVAAAPVAAPAQPLSPAPSPPLAVSAPMTPMLPPSSASSTAGEPSDPTVSGAPANNPAANANAPAAVMNLRMEPSLSARRALDALLSTPAPGAPRAPTTATAASTPAVVAPTLVAASGLGASLAPSPADRPKTRSAVANGATSNFPPNDNTSAPTIQRQQQAGGDAIAQAQNLWNSGSHDAAMDLMQQSIAATERSLKAGTAAGSSTTVLVPLVREMTRMQLAEGRFGAVWELLTRLEQLLGNQADLWAIRANAAQRLGRHPDSVHAYMMALQTRPDEQRWLLGTAVSLAALGQTTSAAEMAEKARAVGPVSKDILAYLRQTGVPIREQ